MLEPGDYVQTIRATHHYRAVPKGTRGTVRSLDGDWATLELPEGGRVQSHVENLIRIDRAQPV